MPDCTNRRSMRRQPTANRARRSAATPLRAPRATPIAACTPACRALVSRPTCLVQRGLTPRVIRRQQRRTSSTVTTTPCWDPTLPPWRSTSRTRLSRDAIPWRAPSRHCAHFQSTWMASGAFERQTSLLDRRDVTFGRNAARVRMGTVNGARQNFVDVTVETRSGREWLTVRLSRGAEVRPTRSPARASKP